MKMEHHGHICNREKRGGRKEMIDSRATKTPFESLKLMLDKKRLRKRYTERQRGKMHIQIHTSIYLYHVTQLSNLVGDL